MTRVTIDLDNPSWLRVVSTYFNLWYMTGVRPQIRRSASGEGFHIKTHGFNGSFDNMIKIRELLGDDELRVRFDTEKVAEPTQVLFTMKNNKKATEWSDDIERVL